MEILKNTVRFAEKYDLDIEHIEEYEPKRWNRMLCERMTPYAMAKMIRLLAMDNRDLVYHLLKTPNVS